MGEQREPTIQRLLQEIERLRDENRKLRKPVGGKVASDVPLRWPATGPGSSHESQESNLLNATGGGADSRRSQEPQYDGSMTGQLSEKELDRLPYGVITVDHGGAILFYNDTGQRSSSIPRDRLINRNFFQQVAPWPPLREFEAQFRGFAQGDSSSPIKNFDFVFDFEKRKQYVAFVFTPGRVRGTVNIVLTRRTTEKQPNRTD